MSRKKKFPLKNKSLGGTESEKGLQRGSVGSQKLQEHDPEVVKKRRFPVLQVLDIFYL